MMRTVTSSVSARVAWRVCEDADRPMYPLAELGHPIPYLWFLVVFHADDKHAMQVVEICRNAPRQGRFPRTWLSVDANKAKRIHGLRELLSHNSQLVALDIRVSGDYVPGEGRPFLKLLLAGSICGM